MSTYAVPEDKLTAIADAIRLKRDITTLMSLDDMALQVGLIDGGGGGLELIASADFALSSDCTATSTTTLLSFTNSNFVGFAKNERLLISIELIDAPTASTQFLRKEMMVSSNYNISAADGVITRTNGTATVASGNAIGLTCAISTAGKIDIKGRYNSSYTGSIKAGNYRLNVFKL